MRRETKQRPPEMSNNWTYPLFTSGNYPLFKVSVKLGQPHVLKAPPFCGEWGLERITNIRPDPNIPKRCMGCCSYLIE